jgi:hypothetical protein
MSDRADIGGVPSPRTRAGKHRWNVLVLPGGTEIGVEIHRALRHCKEVRLFSAANDAPNHAAFVFEHHRVIPGVSEPGWLAALNALIVEWGIDYVFPANAPLIDALDAVRDRLACPALLAPSETIARTRDKAATYRQLQGLLPVPVCYADPDAVASWPVFVKPRRGYGAQRAQRVESGPELRALLAREPDLLIQPYLSGEEYTVDCFTDREGRLRYCAGRARVRVRMGTSMRAEIVTGALAETFRQYAETISRVFSMRGPWFFQLKADTPGGTLTLLEVEARIAGTMALSRALGVNFPLLTLLDFAGESYEIRANEGAGVVLDRCLANHYRHGLDFQRVYVDLDDTLLIHNRLNTELVRFLYDCVNAGREIVLISKCLAEDKPALLRRWRLSELFDRTLWLAESQAKADFIDPSGGAIFIDDSFSERMAVAQRHGIATFHPSMVELLLSERG